MWVFRDLGDVVPANWSFWSGVVVLGWTVESFVVEDDQGSGGNVGGCLSPNFQVFGVKPALKDASSSREHCSGGKKRLGVLNMSKKPKT